jgi:uncharacterized membrane protein SpoIIM required for sporulation
MEWNLKRYFYLTASIYVIVFLLSVFVFPQLFGNFHGDITYDQLRIGALNLTPMSAFTRLIIGNVLVSFLIIISGALGMELLPIAILTWNAFNFGEIIAMVNKPDTINILYSFFPHAIFELPATILVTTFACYYALKMREVTGNKGLLNLLRYEGSITIILHRHVLKPYLFYILPLIIAGCLVESTISIYIMRALFI